MSSASVITQCWAAWNARRLCRLASVHLARGNPDIAHRYARRADALWMRVPGVSASRVGAMRLLASSDDQRGNLAQASVTLAAAAEWARNAGSSDGAMGSAEVAIQHGDLKRRLGDYTSACDLFEEALAAVVALRSAYPALVASALNGRGIVAKDRGRFPEAAAFYSAALRTAQGAPSPDRLTADVQHNLAGLAHARQDYVAGVGYAEQAIRGHSRTLGPRCPSVAGDMGVLGANLTGAGDLGAARKVLSQAEKMFARHYGSDHYEVAVVMHNLAAIDALEGDVERARERCAAALRIKVRFLGEQHAEVAALRESLQSLQQTGRIGPYRPPVRTSAT